MKEIFKVREFNFYRFYQINRINLRRLEGGTQFGFGESGLKKSSENNGFRFRLRKAMSKKIPIGFEFFPSFGIFRIFVFSHAASTLPNHPNYPKIVLTLKINALLDGLEVFRG